MPEADTSCVLAGGGGDVREVVTAFDSALTSSAALLTAIVQVHNALSAGAAALGGVLATLATSPGAVALQTARILGAHLAALQAEGDVVSSCLGRFAGAQAEMSKEVFRWASALLPEETLAPQVHNLEQALAARQTEGSLVSLCKEHPHATMRWKREVPLQKPSPLSMHGDRMDQAAFPDAKQVSRSTPRARSACLSGRPRPAVLRTSTADDILEVIGERSMRAATKGVSHERRPIASSEGEAGAVGQAPSTFNFATSHQWPLVHEQMPEVDVPLSRTWPQQQWSECGPTPVNATKHVLPQALQRPKSGGPRPGTASPSGLRSGRLQRLEIAPDVASVSLSGGASHQSPDALIHQLQEMSVHLQAVEAEMAEVKGELIVLRSKNLALAHRSFGAGGGGIVRGVSSACPDRPRSAGIVAQRKLIPPDSSPDAPEATKPVICTRIPICKDIQNVERSEAGFALALFDGSADVQRQAQRQAVLLRREHQAETIRLKKLGVADKHAFDSQIADLSEELQQAKQDSANSQKRLTDALAVIDEQKLELEAVKASAAHMQKRCSVAKPRALAPSQVNAKSATNHQTSAPCTVTPRVLHAQLTAPAQAAGPHIEPRLSAAALRTDGLHSPSPRLASQETTCQQADCPHIEPSLSAAVSHVDTLHLASPLLAIQETVCQQPANQHVASNHQTDHRFEAFTEDATIQATARRMWSMVRTYWRSLAAPSVRWMPPEARCVAARFSGLCAHLRSVPDLGAGAPLEEIVEKLLRAEGFARRVRECEVVMERERMAAGTTRRATDPQAAADNSFQAMGGSPVVASRLQQVERLARSLHRNRRVYRSDGQDPGFSSLGPESLYAAASDRIEKLRREVLDLAMRTRGQALLPGLKDREQAAACVHRQFGGDWSRLTDVLRVVVLYPSICSLYDAVEALLTSELKEHRRDFVVVRVDNLELCKAGRGEVRGHWGVRVLVEVDGLVAEVQLRVRQIHEALRGPGHKVWKTEHMLSDLLFESVLRKAGRHTATVLAAQASSPGSKASSAVKAMDRLGRTALHYSCQGGSPHITWLLIRSRADPWAADEQAILPCELALRYGQHEAFLIVLASMAEGFLEVPDEHPGLQRLGQLVGPWWCDFVLREPAASQGVEDRANARLVSVGRALVQVLLQRRATRALDVLLRRSVAGGEVGRVRILLAMGLDALLHQAPAAREPSALDIAIECGQLSMASMLRSLTTSGKQRSGGLRGAKCSRETVHSHLRAAAMQEQKERAIAAIECRADPNHVTASAHGKRTPLMCFAAAGNASVCNRLLSARASVLAMDLFGCSAAHYARANGHADIEADLQAVRVATDLPLKSGEEPAAYLSEASRHGCSAAIWRSSLKRRSSVVLAMAPAESILSQPIGPYKNTPLHLAVEAARDGVDPAGQMVRALLRARANPGAKTSKGDTPLHVAAAACLAPIFTMLEQSLGAEQTALLAEEANEFGQKPIVLMKRAQLKSAEEQRQTEEGGEVLLRAAFLAFVRCALLPRLDDWRHQAASNLLEAFKVQRAAVFTAGRRGSVIEPPEEFCDANGARRSSQAPASGGKRKTGLVASSASHLPGAASSSSSKRKG